MMTIGFPVAPVERQKELAEVFVETYCPLTKYSQDWKWEIADEFCRNNIRAATRAVLEEAFRRLEANQNALYKPAYQMWKTDAHKAVCYDVYYLRACKDFLLAGLTSSSANVSPQDSMNKL